MPATVLVGAQWGDEGKGKVTDYLAEQADMVVRYQGGSNAGHTVKIGEEEFKLHLVPSGIFYPGKTCVIGNGVVVDPGVLVGELRALQARGVDTSGLRLSLQAHIILPYHKDLDAAQEEMRGEDRIGTTQRGIGPAYIDKVGRTGIRVADFLDPEEFRRRLEICLKEKNKLLGLYGRPGYTVEAILEEYAGYSAVLQPLAVDTPPLIDAALKEKKKVLFEGAQGTLLDVDQGTYPFVTSSHPVAGGACVGAGVGPTRINKVIGVAKAYTTRVGEGPFPTEDKGAVGTALRERGGEFGTTTGRPRRCGWLDVVILRHAVRVNGLTGLALTKLDVLSGLERVRICTAYEYGEQRISDFPPSLKVLAGCRPVYEELPGWQEDIGGARTLDDLPPACRAYVRRVEELVGVPVVLIAVGPRRDQTISIGSVW
ncbi:MAG: adenylosuccinate synthase [Clostridia bacterium]|nr:adenylosuccinate synthase [Clostridia bacterium]